MIHYKMKEIKLINEINVFSKHVDHASYMYTVHEDGMWLWGIIISFLKTSKFEIYFTLNHFSTCTN